MGRAQRQRYGGLVVDGPERSRATPHGRRAAPCEAVVATYCEEGMVRDEKTAEAFFLGMGCEDARDIRGTFIHDDADFILDQGSTPRGDHGECRLLSQEETKGRVGGDLGKRFQELSPHRERLEKLSDLLGCCAQKLCGGGHHRQPKVECGMKNLPTSWSDKWYTTFEGPLYAAKYFSEWIFLTMLNGSFFTGDDDDDDDDDDDVWSSFL